MTLPNAFRRAELRSFCLVMSGGALIMLTLMFCTSRISAYGAAAIACLCAAGLVYPRLVRTPYRIWNKSAKLYAHFASFYIMTVSFQLVVRPMGAVVSSEQFSDANASSSFWRESGSAAAPAYGSQYEVSDRFSTQAPWPVGYFSWAWRKKNFPALLLLPLLMLLSAVQTEEEALQVSDIYTLF